MSKKYKEVLSESERLVAMIHQSSDTDFVDDVQWDEEILSQMADVAVSIANYVDCQDRTTQIKMEYMIEKRIIKALKNKAKAKS